MAEALGGFFPPEGVRSLSWKQLLPWIGAALLLTGILVAAFPSQEARAYLTAGDVVGYLLSPNEFLYNLWTSLGMDDTAARIFASPLVLMVIGVVILSAYMGFTRSSSEEARFVGGMWR